MTQLDREIHELENPMQAMQQRETRGGGGGGGGSPQPKVRKGSVLMPFVPHEVTARRGAPSRGDARGDRWVVPRGDDA